MKTPVNTFKQALREGRPQFGLWVGLADPYAIEAVAGAGFDWLLIDGEHAPNDLRTTLGQLQAVAPYPGQPVVRPVIGDPALIKQLLDIGAQTLLVPVVDTAEQAAMLVAATRYPPRGIRGVGSALARSSRWNLIGDYLHTADEQMYLLGQPGHPDVVEAILGGMAAVRAAGKAPGVLAPDPTLARRYLDAGALFVAVGVDTTLLTRACRDLVAAWKGAGAPPPASGSTQSAY